MRCSQVPAMGTGMGTGAEIARSDIDYFPLALLEHSASFTCEEELPMFLLWRNRYDARWMRRKPL